MHAKAINIFLRAAVGLEKTHHARSWIERNTLDRQFGVRPPEPPFQPELVCIEIILGRVQQRLDQPSMSCLRAETKYLP